jgi:hypothetical protein
VPCTDCPANRYSTATAATSNATCQACMTNAVSPVSSSDSSMCLCNYGYNGVDIRTNIANLARSCGTGSEACDVVVDSEMDWPSAQSPAWRKSYLNNGDTDSGWGAWFMSLSNPALHWARIEFASAYVTGIQFASYTYYGGSGFFNLGVFVGNNPNVNSPENSLCAIIPDAESAVTGMTINYMTVTCNTPVSGKYIFVSNRCNQGTVGVDRGNCNALKIWELRVQGYIVTGNSCGACTAGTFKDTLGSAACTNCPANYYSGLTARTSNATCTPCYENSVSPAGSVSMDACNCVAGYEFT